MTDFKEHPQPRTFAPSKEDVLQNLQYFFGAPVSPEKLKDYSEHHAMTCAPSLVEPCTFPQTYKCHPFPVRRPFPGRLRGQEHADPRHSQQPHPQVAPELADLGAPNAVANNNPAHTILGQPHC